MSVRARLRFELPKAALDPVALIGIMESKHTDFIPGVWHYNNTIRFTGKPMNCFRANVGCRLPMFTHIANDSSEVINGDVNMNILHITTLKLFWANDTARQVTKLRGKFNESLKQMPKILH